MTPFFSHASPSRLDTLDLQHFGVDEDLSQFPLDGAHRHVSSPHPTPFPFAPISETFLFSSTSVQVASEKASPSPFLRT